MKTEGVKKGSEKKPDIFGLFHVLISNNFIYFSQTQFYELQIKIK